MGEAVPVHLGRLLIIDTATDSGATLRKAASSPRFKDVFGF
jgi:hypothetical protein